MPNRDGEDTRYHPSRGVSPERWRETVGRGAVEGSQYSSVPSGLVHVDPSPYGWNASHTRSTGVARNSGLERGPAFDEEISHYGAGPFKTEHRAKRAALSLADRDEDRLERHQA